MKLVVPDAEINHLLPEVLPPDIGIENVRLRVKPEGLVITGAYPAFGFSVSFEMLWDLATIPGGIEARLKDLKVAGFPAGKFRGLLVKMIRDAVGNVPGVQVDDERAIVNVAEMLRGQKVSARVDVTALRCLEGTLEIEARVGGPLIA